MDGANEITELTRCGVITADFDDSNSSATISDGVCDNKEQDLTGQLRRELGWLKTSKILSDKDLLVAVTCKLEPVCTGYRGASEHLSCQGSGLYDHINSS